MFRASLATLTVEPVTVLEESHSFITFFDAETQRRRTQRRRSILSGFFSTFDEAKAFLVNAVRIKKEAIEREFNQASQCLRDVEKLEFAKCK